MTYRYKYNRTLLQFSAKNKREQTIAEKHLWRRLQNRSLKGFKFRRQYPIQNYILDFYCVEKKIVVELDGSQHLQNKNYDKQRTIDLEKLGIKILRFWDNDVLKNLDNVLEQILIMLEEKPNTTSP